MAIQIGHHDSCNVVLGLLTTNSLSNLGKCIKFLQSLVYFSGKKSLGSIRASQTCTYLYTWIIWRSYKKNVNSEAVGGWGTDVLNFKSSFKWCQWYRCSWCMDHSLSSKGLNHGAIEHCLGKDAYRFPIPTLSLWSYPALESLRSENLKMPCCPWVYENLMVIWIVQ